MADEYLKPTSDVVTGWARWGGAAAPNYPFVDDDTATPAYGSGESLKSDYTARTDQYGMSDVVSMGASDTATQIQVLAWASGNETIKGNLSARIYINGGWVTSAEGAQAVLDTWPTHRWYTFTFTGTWTQTHVNGLEVEVSITSNNGSNDDYLSCVRAMITYSAGGTANPALMNSMLRKRRQG